MLVIPSFDTISFNQRRSSDLTFASIAANGSSSNNTCGFGANAQKAIVRPEFLELAKKGELKRYMSAAEKGIVEDVIFSGSRLDVIVNINGIKVTAERSLEKDRVEVGEEVDVLIYRLYVFDDKETYLLENKEMQEGDVFYI